jgi:competence protein ComEC
VLGLAGLLRSGRRSRAAALVASGAALFWLVGGEPSVVRAAAMGTIGVGGLLVGRPSRAPAALATAVVVLLAADPWLAVELGFVLSVLATAAIVLLARAWVQRWSPALGQEAAAGLAVPLAAQLACAPVLLVAGPGVGPYAVLANVAVAPAVAPATVLGVLAAALAPVAPAAALPLAHVAGAACWWIAAVAHAVAGAPGAQVTWAAGPVGIAALAAVGASMAGLLLRVRPDPARRSRRR